MANPSLIEHKHSRLRERIAFVLVGLALLAAITYPVTSKFLACQTIFGNLKCHLVTKPYLFDNAKIIKTEHRYITVDPYEYMHFKIPASQAKQLVSGNILRDCEDKNSWQHCTGPIWLNSQQTKAWDYIGNADYYTDTVFCTAHWAKITHDYPNYRDEICADTYTGDVWYSYNEI